MRYMKAHRKREWIKRGVKFTDEEFEFIWGVYENIENCMLCSKYFNDSFDKCLDHNHKTGEVRFILCRSCNKIHDRQDNKLGEPFICEEIIDGNPFYSLEKTEYGVRIYRKRFSKRKWTLEQVIKIRNELFNTLD